MRIVLAIMFALAGLASIVYAYLGVLYHEATDVVRAETAEESVDGVFSILSMLIEGDIPMLSNFLYLGALFVALAVMTAVGVFGGRARDDEPEPKSDP